MSGRIENLLNQAQLKEDESSVITSEKAFSDKQQAARAFAILKTKILDVGEWNDHGLLSSYKLFEESGRESSENENFFIGAFLRISLKGSGKYDWVKIQDIFESADEFVVTVKPTFDPTDDAPDKTAVSHFFTDEATNNFCLLKKGETVFFYVIGLDEKQNTTETDNALETVRNVAVNLGSYLGVQTGEWKKFTEGFLKCAGEELFGRAEDFEKRK